MLHVEPMTLAGFDGCDLVVVDLGWTPQRLAAAAALRWLRGTPPRRAGRIITLVKPHYEAPAAAIGGGRRGVLDDEKAQRVCDDVVAGLSALGVRIAGVIESPIRGGGKRGRAGNREWLAMLEPGA